MRRRAILIPLLCGLLLALFMAARLGAHGIGKPQVVNERVGPYLISVCTDPDPLRADETHVVVGVTNPDTREPVVGGIEVTVALVSAADPAVVADFARHDPYGRHGLVTRWTIRPLARSHRRRVRRAVNNFPRQVKGLARLPLKAALQ